MVQNIQYMTESNLYAMVAVYFFLQRPYWSKFKDDICISICLDAYLSQHDTQPQGKYNLHSISDEKYYV